MRVDRKLMLTPLLSPLRASFFLSFVASADSIQPPPRRFNFSPPRREFHAQVARAERKILTVESHPTREKINSTSTLAMHFRRVLAGEEAANCEFTNRAD